METKWEKEDTQDIGAGEPGREDVKRSTSLGLGGFEIIDLIGEGAAVAPEL